MTQRLFRERLYELVELIIMSLMCGVLAACLFLLLALIAFAMGA